MSVENTGSGNLNLGMYQLITQERERLGVRFVCDYEIWQDENTALPGYEGYEHFEVKRGWGFVNADDPFWAQWYSEASRKRYPKEEERAELVECGFEFISIMKLAALSIGTAAVYGKPSFSDLTELFPPPGTDLFWQHLIQSWISLGMASDRVRTFFIQFVRREDEEQLDRKIKAQEKHLAQRSQQQPPQFVYIQAFHEFPTARLPSNESRQRLRALQGLLENIADIRLKRNSFVHDYASREAMIVAAQRDSRRDHADVFKAFNGDKDISSYIRELADAYNVLVQVGNLVFSLEKDVTEHSTEKTD